MTDKPEKQTRGEELVKQDVVTREELDEAHKREAESGTPWHRWLLSSGKVTFGALDDFLRYEYRPKAEREKDIGLGQILLDMKALTKQDLDEALVIQKRSGRFLGIILLERGKITPRVRALALAKQHGMEFSDIEASRSDPHALDLVPESVAIKNKMVPIRLEGDKIVVLIDEPNLRTNLESVGVIIGKRIYPILTASDDIRKEIKKRYQEKSHLHLPQILKSKEKKDEMKAENVLLATKPVVEKPESKKKTEDKKAVADKKESATVDKTSTRFDEIAKQAQGVPVVKLVSTIIEGAANSGATDIHLDPQDPEMRVRYRIDGVLHDVMSIPRDSQLAVVSRIKILADMDITETRRPQDGHISLAIGDGEFDVRVATLPTYLGERMVLRMLDQSSVLAGIRDLGLEPEDEERLQKLIDQPYGMILVTGPTGSGKTTTLYASLNQKNVMTDSIVTLEDPVEYQLSGINQVQIDNDIDLTFANTLRASLRQDIDVLLVGEIRDAETARIAVRAAMTGHLVFSTLHTNDAPEAISTLRNMGVPSFLIASALTAVVGQRLVRKICPKCKEAFVADKEMIKSLGLPPTVKKLYQGRGCEACYQTGTKGRTGIFEILEITPTIRKAIAGEESMENIMKLSKLKTMSDRCREKVKDGVVPAEEFLRVIRT